MESDKPAKPAGNRNAFSRRNLLKGAATLTAASSVPNASAQTPTGAPFWNLLGLRRHLHS